MKKTRMPRREFIKMSAAVPSTLAVLGATHALAASDDDRDAGAPPAPRPAPARSPRDAYAGPTLSRVAFPLGGIGAGMICIEGTGSLSHLSLHHRPEVFNEPHEVFSALWVKQIGAARVLEGPVPGWKKFGQKGPEYGGSGSGGGGTTYGLPRFARATFASRFPFGEIALDDPALPVKVLVRAWSPFVPGDSFHSSLPVAALEIAFTNSGPEVLDCVYSFNARNFMTRGDGKLSSVETLPNGFTFSQKPLPDKPHEEGYFSVFTPDVNARANGRWFRGGWFDALTMIWRDVAAGSTASRPAAADGAPSPGASLMVPFALAAGATRTVTVQFCWYVPASDVRVAATPWGDNTGDCAADCACHRFYKPWYATAFPDLAAVRTLWAREYAALRAQTQRFTDCFYDTDLAGEAVEAVAANLSILKSPTILRQEDGRLWAWEGCNDDSGCCHGSCTHVWNYAQALAHLFPDLERTFRQTEFGECQDDSGNQTFRAPLPIQPIKGTHLRPAAADGQLGGVMRVYREWRVSGDTAWLRGLWPRLKQSLDFCVATWDPDRLGALIEPHHNTYDIEFWGPDAMCTAIYLGALRAMVLMGRALGEDTAAYAGLADKSQAYLETKLFNDRWFFQRVRWRDLRAKPPLEDPEQLKHIYNSPEAVALCEREGPKYQYGTGCLSDQLLGQFEAHACGVGRIVNAAKARTALASVFKHNFKADLSAHVNTQRPTYACGNEGGLILCSWPDGDKLSLPFPYSDEVWTGIEYQVACGLIFEGLVDEGLTIVRTLRARYDGRDRNPFDEYECGHWYARALSSYALLQALSGARYDAVDKVLYLRPAIKGDFRSFLATATGYGTVGVRSGQPFADVAAGAIEIKEIKYAPWA
ncbi:MAG TPA: GH116 family glycosyl hydrolase [Opitutaceae bacterium]|nr:GH116 family glycosyl hydrolase [Opitutaceae bacterium]